METLHGKKQESIDRSLEFSKLGKAFYVPNVLMALMNRPIIKAEVFSGFEPAASDTLSRDSTTELQRHSH